MKKNGLYERVCNKKYMSDGHDKIIVNGDTDKQFK